MRKKDLLNQNVMLFEQLRKVELENTALRKKNKSLEGEIEALNKKIEDLTAKPVYSEPLIALEEKITETAVLDDATSYGADAIGKIVLRATEYNGKLSENTTADSRTLINLILGRTEISKSEILAVVSDDCGFDTKKSRIHTIMNEAFEYFESVMAQID
ncbi:MAG: hypothetical protein IJZ75_02335 [Clostridia bacterium]|nr:hypothetical protein [Clostridia bacterium]